LSLDQAIARCYDQERQTETDRRLSSKVVQSVEKDPGSETVHSDLPEAQQVLLVTDETETAPLVRALLEQDGFNVTITDSADDAIDMAGNHSYYAVFVQDTVPGDYLDLIDRVRKISPRTRVRYYEQFSTMILNDDVVDRESIMLSNVLNLFTSILSSKDKLTSNHSGTVGQLADRLCRELGLPDQERMTIITAAYLHDLADFYYGPQDAEGYREKVQLTAKLLESLNGSPVVVAVLKSMYVDLKGKYTKRLPIEILGGNILTIVDLFCENSVPDHRMSYETFEAIKTRINDAIGKLFLTEVAEAFIAMIQKDILNLQPGSKYGQVMVYSDDYDILGSIEERLQYEGFRVLVEKSVDSFVELFHRSRPDIMLLLLNEEARSIESFIDRLARDGIDFHDIPTFLLVERSLTSQLTSLFAKGIEDVISLDASLDLLIIKMSRIQSQLETKASKQIEIQQEEAVTKGRLADMNLIDLLQALGPSRKTARISIATPTIVEPLEMFLLEGRIVFAILAESTGAEAVYEAVGWNDGSWRVETLSPDNIPEHNNDLPNESILMEACRRFDEKQRDLHNKSQSAPAPETTG
jgi:DNA-binding response OmpR family regulator